ncbi:tryptophan halogenase family protein [Tsuneonella sp. SYSU-LHT278]|uniref:tryptophan halogenase family protein n=1 Tax=Tsuneonella sediminis TaxID=3416089 RepID=UPI003F79C4D9
MPDRPMRNFVIVGGGTAGWMTAALLIRFLDDRYTVTVVESDEIGTVGVGEATIPMLRNVNRALGFDEADFVAATRGTFKLGIEFDGWLRPGERYIHAFGNIGRGLGLLPFHQYWLRAAAEGRAGPLAEHSPCAQAAWAHRFAPSPDSATGAAGNLAWAYHFDASLYAAYLRRFAEARGARRVEGRIVDVGRDPESGHISEVRLAGGDGVGGDFFVDCSGFAAMLVDKTLGVPFEDWSQWLPCDRAVAVPGTSATPTLPYTRSIAGVAGWQWRIPLQHRTGNGHVYCSEFLTDDEAASALLASIEGDALADPRLLRFTTGMRREAWRGNCVAIGLAAGFLEPLESTSIHLVQSAVDRLLKFLPGEGIAPADVDEYNRQTRIEWEGIRDFLILHYHRNERSEPFWRRCAAMGIPDRLKDRIELFAQGGRIARHDEELFTEVAWLQVMLGQGVTPRNWHPLADSLSQAQLEELMALSARSVSSTVGRMPLHDDYLARFCRHEETVA